MSEKHLDPEVNAVGAESAPAAGERAEQGAPPTLRERLALVLHELRFSDTARITGVHPETVRRYLTRSSPSVEFVIAVCSHFDISLDWMLLGRGPRQGADVAIHVLASVPLSDLVGVVEDRLSKLKEDASPEGAQRRMLATRLRRIVVPQPPTDADPVRDAPEAD